MLLIDLVEPGVEALEIGSGEVRRAGRERHVQLVALEPIAKIQAALDRDVGRVELHGP